MEDSLTGRAGLANWLVDYQLAATQTDQLRDEPRHADILALGLVGEVGSILAERKKEQREKAMYPRHRSRLTDELGDALWYLVRTVDVLGCDPAAICSLCQVPPALPRNEIDDAIALGTAAARLLQVVTADGNDEACLRDAVESVAQTLANVGFGANLPWPSIAEANVAKIRSRWPQEREGGRVLECTAREEERFPRQLSVEFHEIPRGETSVVLMRCRGLNLGDRLTDNIIEQDYYRFHDVFHFSYAVFLGWSPVLRALLKCKRKSLPDVDENQDGARAQIVEEAVSALVFSHAKEIEYFEGARSLDYELLKSITELVKGYEVDEVPLYRWEEAILAGYDAFRHLREHNGGVVHLDLDKHTLTYRASN